MLHRRGDLSVVHIFCGFCDPLEFNGSLSVRFQSVEPKHAVESSHKTGTEVWMKTELVHGETVDQRSMRIEDGSFGERKDDLNEAMVAFKAVIGPSEYLF